MKSIHLRVLMICCVANVALAQTFQYSRGWTNGKKRSMEENPCNKLQAMKWLMTHSPFQFYLPHAEVPKSGLPEASEEPSQDFVERFRRLIPQEPSRR